LRKSPDFDARVALVPQSGLHIQRQKAFPKRHGHCSINSALSITLFTGFFID
jgi:hypothetical protein